MKKKTFIKLLIFLNIIPLLGVPITLVSLGFSLPNAYEDSFLGELKYKYDKLTSTKENKIVFIGGSSLPFGIRSSYIEDYFKTNLSKDYKVINFGMYAALGTKVMLDLAKENISKDDIVIISPEQQEQTLSLYFNGKMMWQALDGRMDLFNKIAKDDKEKMIGDYVNYIKDKIDLLSHTIDYSNTVYARSSFDEYGDIASELCMYNTMNNYHDETMPVRFDEKVISEDFITYLNDFNKEMEKIGAITYYHFSPMNRLAITGDVDFYYSFLNNKLDFNILGDPHNSILDYEYFYDTNFHLNNVGALLNTLNIIKELKIEYEDTTPYNIEIPDKPQIQKEDDTTGNNSMLSYFNIVKTNDQATITGLINKDANQIILPYSFDNTLITSFKNDVFQNNKKLRNLTIQSNIRILQNDSFSGCSNLEKIIILNEKPSSIIPSESFLNNCDANIYVPSNVVSIYKTNYVWSRFSNRIKALEIGEKL